MNKPVKTTPPDFRFQNFADWHLYVQLERITASQKVLAIKYQETISPRLKIIQEA